MRFSKLIIRGATSFGLTIFFAAFAAFAEPIDFDNTWKRQGFFRFWSNKYELSGNRLGVTSDGTVSLLFRKAPATVRAASSASWRWSVSTSVVATDLAIKGGDDRNLVIYFAFADQETADRLSSYSVRRMMRNKSVRLLAYVWGGDYPRGKIIPSPYGDGNLNTVMLRKAGTGDFLENVDISADYLMAFGEQRGALIGFGVTADSDDTNGRIDAIVENLVAE